MKQEAKIPQEIAGHNIANKQTNKKTESEFDFPNKLRNKR